MVLLPKVPQVLQHQESTSVCLPEWLSEWTPCWRQHLQSMGERSTTAMPLQHKCVLAQKKKTKTLNLSQNICIVHIIISLSL